MEQQADREDDDAPAEGPSESNGDRPAGRPLPPRPEMHCVRKPRPGFPWAALVVLFLVFGMCLLLALLSQGLLLALGFVAGGIALICGFHYLVWGWWLGAVIRREEEEDNP